MNTFTVFISTPPYLGYAAYLYLRYRHNARLYKPNCLLILCHCTRLSATHANAENNTLGNNAINHGLRL